MNFKIRPQLKETVPTTSSTDDKDLSAADLQAKYSTGNTWGKHPTRTPKEWKEAVANNDTRSSYWEWVVSEIESGSDEDGEDSNDAPV